MWFLVPAILTVGAFYLAWQWCDGEATRSDYGSLLVGVLNVCLFVAAAFVSLVAWLVYFILN